MLSLSSDRIRQRLASYSRLALGVFVAALLIPSEALAQPPQPVGQFALDFLTPGSSHPWMRVPLRIGNNAVVVYRNELIVIDAGKAGDFTGVYLKAELDSGVVSVTLSVLYNDLSDKEWVLHKRETPAGSHQLREGESVRPVQLAQFGIAPFELKVINARARVLNPGEGPRIINNTTALQVERIEMHLDGYHLWLKNTSNKNVTALRISGGATGVTSESPIGRPIIPAGGISEEERPGGLPGDEITISLAVFEDGTFEGDSEQASRLVAKAEGLRIQAPNVLRRVEQALTIDDAEFISGFDKLEAELWFIPEAIDKQSAIELLRKEFPSLDDKRVSSLYEDLKGGLYDARNIALAEMGVNRRSFRERQQQDGDDIKATKSLRATLERVKQTLERIVSGKP